MNVTYPPCRLCGIKPASCKAHIIPKQFYKRIRGDAPHLFELQVGDDVNRRFSQSGIKEQGILCTDCDRKLGVFDQYGYNVLPENIVQNKVQMLGNAYDLGLIDIEKFKFFLIALVWRASRSSHPLF